MVCTGHCCENFTLVVEGKPITHVEWSLGGFREGDLGSLAFPAGAETRFNCRMFDPVTRLCKDYENRPDTCRSYPKGTLQNGVLTNTCQHCGLEEN
jgi:Fe-S-cluster containining protein